MAGEVSSEEWGRIWAKAWLEANRDNDNSFKRACEYDPAAAIYAVRHRFNLQNTKIFDLEKIFYDSGAADPTYPDPEYLERVIKGQETLSMPLSTWHFS